MGLAPVGADVSLLEIPLCLALKTCRTKAPTAGKNFLLGPSERAPISATQLVKSSVLGLWQRGWEGREQLGRGLGVLPLQAGTCSAAQ